MAIEDFYLPKTISKQVKMFVLPIYPVAEMIYRLQKEKGANLDDYRLVVPTESDNQFGIEKFYIVHKDSVK